MNDIAPRTRRAWVTAEPLNVAPALVGRPLATPSRRALAMGLDLLIVALLSGANEMLLVLGIVLVAVQLRSGRGALPGSPQALHGRPRWRFVVGSAGVLLVLALVGQEVSQRWQGERSEPRAAKPQAAAPPEHAASMSDAERIAALESQLAEARRDKPFRLRREIDHLADSIGLGFGWGIVYFSLLPAWWGGQTLGKRAFGIQVAELTGKPMTVLRCLKRYGGYAAGMATGGVGFLQLLWDPNRQALQDKAAHTVVLDLRAAAGAAYTAPHDASSAQ